MKRIVHTFLLLTVVMGPALAQVAIVPGDRFRSSARDDVSLESFRSFYVVTEVGEDEDDEKDAEMRLAIDSFIVDALLQLGLNASSGGAADMPAGTEVKVTYESMIEKSRRATGVTDLAVFFRDPDTNIILAMVEMENVQNLPGPDMIRSAVHYIVNGSVSLSESPYSVSELTKAYDVEEVDPVSAVPGFSPRGQIRIVIAQPSVRWPLLYPLRTVARKEYVDYRQLLEVAKEALEEQIRQAGGVVVAEGGEKTISLSVSDLTNIAIFQTFINFTIEMGDGYTQGLQAYGKNWNYRKSVDLAVADMPIRVLSDPSVIAYLER